MHIAIVGSREYPHLEDVKALVEHIAADNPCAVIVSGGAKGVDKMAEETANAAGLEVISFRVRQIDDENFGTEEWYFSRSGGGNVRLMIEEPTWQTYDDALSYRNALIIERAERVVAFHDGLSRGTQLALDFTKAFDRPLKKYGTDGDRLKLAA